MVFLSNYLVFKIVLAALGRVDYPVAGDLELKYDNANKIYLSGGSLKYVDDATLYTTIGGETTNYELGLGSILNKTTTTAYEVTLPSNSVHATFGINQDATRYVHQYPVANGYLNGKFQVYSGTPSGGYTTYGSEIQPFNGNEMILCSMSADGKYILVTTWNGGNDGYKMYKDNGSSYVYHSAYPFIGSHTSSGYTPAFVPSNNNFVITGTDNNSTWYFKLYVYNSSTETWTAKAQVTPSGSSTADGQRGTTGKGFTYDGSYFFQSNNGATTRGEVWSVDWNGNTMTKLWHTTEGNNGDGAGGAISPDNRYVVLCQQTGNPYRVYENTSGDWSTVVNVTSDFDLTGSGTSTSFGSYGINFSGYSSKNTTPLYIGQAAGLYGDGKFRLENWSKGSPYQIYITDAGKYSVDANIAGLNYKTNEVEVTGSITPVKSFPTTAQKLYPSDGGTVSDSDAYGYVGLSGNGLVMVIVGKGDDDTTTDSGGFMVYEKINNVWTYTQQITNVGSGSGTLGLSEEGKAVQLDYTGTRVFIGAHADDNSTTNTGSVYIYKRVAQGNWTLEQTLTGASGSYRYGYNDVNNDGDKLMIGSYGYPGSGNVGRAWYYTRSGTSWSLQDQLAAPSTSAYGTAVAMNSTGTRVIIGGYTHSSNKGRADIWNYSGGSWSIGAGFTGVSGSDFFGWNVDMSNDGNTVVVGAPLYSGGGSEGRAYIYTTSDGTNWSLLKTLSNQDADEWFGFSVQISGDGNTVVIGAGKNDEGLTNRGKSYVYVKSGGSWPSTPTHTILGTTANANNGYTLAISDTGETIISGAPSDDDKGTNQGAVYIFDKSTLAELKFDNYNKLSIGNAPTNTSSKLFLGSNVYDIGTLTSDLTIETPGLYRGLVFDTGSNVAYFNKTTVGAIGSTLVGYEVESIIPGYSTSSGNDSAIDFNGDGTRMVVGMGSYNSYDGRAAVYHLENGSWVQKVDIPNPATNVNRFGSHVSMNNAGTRILINQWQHESSSGSKMQIFDYTNNAWSTTPTASVTLASYRSGKGGMDANKDGTVFVTGTAAEGNIGRVDAHRYEGGSWNHTVVSGMIYPGGGIYRNPGECVALDGVGNRCLFGTLDSGGSSTLRKVFESNYDSSSGAWGTPTEVIGFTTGSIPLEIRMSENGTRAVILGTDGYGGIYDRQSGTSWTKSYSVNGLGGNNGQKTVASISYDGTMVLTGNREYDTSITNPGRAYLYQYSGGSWSLTKTYDNPKTTPVASDAFGNSTALAKTTKDRFAIGMSGDDTYGSQYGSVYTYTNAIPDFISFDTYNKLSLSGITNPTSKIHALPTGAESTTTYDIGTATNIYIESAGTYTAEMKGSSAFALDSNVVSGDITPDLSLSETSIAKQFIYDTGGYTDALFSEGSETQSIRLSSDGLAMALGDGNYSSNNGRLYYYERSSISGTFTKTHTFDAVSSGLEFGASVDMNAAKTRIAISGSDADTNAANAGRVYIYDRASTSASWPSSPTATITPPASTIKRFGHTVNMSDDGLTMITSGDGIDSTANRSGVYVYEYAMTAPSAATITFTSGTFTNNSSYYEKGATTATTVLYNRRKPSNATAFTGYGMLLERQSDGTTKAYANSPATESLEPMSLTVNSATIGSETSVTIALNDVLRGWDTSSGYNSFTFTVTSAHLFSQVPEWSKTFQVTQGISRFGFKVAMNKTGTRFIAGGTNTAYYVYHKVSGTWSSTVQLTGATGYHGGMSPDGNTVAVGIVQYSSNLGRVAVYKYNGSSWGSVVNIDTTVGSGAYQIGSTPVFNNDGTLLVTGCGAYNSYMGCFEMWKYESGSWVFKKQFLNPTVKTGHGSDTGEFFGAYLSMDYAGTSVIVSNQGNDVAGADYGRVVLYGAGSPPSLTFDTYNKYTFTGADTGSTYKLKYLSNTYDLGTISNVYIANPGTYSAEIKGATNFALSSNVATIQALPTRLQGSDISTMGTTNYTRYGVPSSQSIDVEDFLFNSSSNINPCIDFIHLTNSQNTFVFDLESVKTISKIRIYTGNTTPNWATRSTGSVVKLYNGSTLVYTSPSLTFSRSSPETYYGPYEEGKDYNTLLFTTGYTNIDKITVETPSTFGALGRVEVNDFTDTLPPSLTFDTYNKLTLSGLESGSTSNVLFNGNTYSIGTASNVYITETGTYEAESKGTTTFALTSKAATVLPTSYIAFHHGAFTASDYSSAYSTVGAAATAGFVYSDTTPATYTWGTLNSVDTSTTGQTGYSWTPTSDITADVLMVAGGGGGSYRDGGGGGAGGLVYNGTQSLSGAKTIVVGSGGDKGTSASDLGDKGNNTTFTGFDNAIGGGGGNNATNNNSNKDGGSGGGGCTGALTGGSGTSGQGNAGGNGSTDPGYRSAGAGGGGAGGVGGSTSSGDKTGADGGAGLDYSSTFGTVVGDGGWFAGGGGGGTRYGTQAGHGPGSPSTGGQGGGGGGGTSSGAAGTAGTRHTGGGGGGGSFEEGVATEDGGDGGNGIVVIRTGPPPGPISLTHDGYKLVVSGITPTSTTLKYGSNTYEIGSATNIYVENTGAYTAEIGGAADFAFTNTTVSGTIKTIEPGFASRYQGSMALTYDGKLYGWGMNDDGEAGVGTSSDITVPTLCTGITQGTVAKLLSSSDLTDNSRGEVSYVKTIDGKIYATGKGDNFVIPGTTSDLTSFTDVTSYFGDQSLTANNVTMMSFTDRSGAALTETGNVWTWGTHDSTNKALGQASAFSTSTTAIAFFSGAFNVAGRYYALDSGKNEYNKRFFEFTNADGTIVNSGNGIEIRHESDGSTKIYANTDDNNLNPILLRINSGSESASITISSTNVTNGDYVEGRNSSGDNLFQFYILTDHLWTVSSSSTPKQINFSSVTGNITKITCGAGHSLALDSSGDVWFWGKNTINSTSWPSSVTDEPQKVVDGKNIIGIASSYGTMFSWDATGKMWNAGNNWEGHIGDGTTTANSSGKTLTEVTYFSSNNITINKVYGGGYFEFADTSDGYYCWGGGTHGVFGNGGTGNITSGPAKWTNVTNIKKFMASTQHTTAITEDGKYYAWGRDYHGSRGDSDSSSDITYPKYIDALPNILAPSFEFDGYNKFSIDDNVFLPPDSFPNIISITYNNLFGSGGGNYSYRIGVSTPTSKFYENYSGSTAEPTTYGIEFRHESDGTTKLYVNSDNNNANPATVKTNDTTTSADNVVLTSNTTEVILENTAGSSYYATFNVTSDMIFNNLLTATSTIKKDVVAYDVGTASIITVPDPGTYDAQLSQGSVFSLKSATVPATKASGLYTWAFHHGNFDNAYGDGDILTARDNGRFYADTPAYTSASIGTITPINYLWPGIGDKVTCTVQSSSVTPATTHDLEYIGDSGGYQVWNTPGHLIYYSSGSNQGNHHHIKWSHSTGWVSGAGSHNSTSVGTSGTTVSFTSTLVYIWSGSPDHNTSKVSTFTDPYHNMSTVPYSTSTSDTTYTFAPPSGGLTANVMMVAGGAGGGGRYTCGGGGAGGLVYTAGTSLANGATKTIVVGNGDSGGNGGGQSGYNGKDTTFTDLDNAIGGGYGGTQGTAGGTGGSGGGGGGQTGNGTGGSATSGQGFAGGTGSNSGSHGGAGGGGAGAVGGNGSNGVGGNGGIGKFFGTGSSFTNFGDEYGEGGYFAGGAGGGTSGSYDFGIPGRGGGGYGAAYDGYMSRGGSQHGMVHTGGGGGGGSTPDRDQHPGYASAGDGGVTGHGGRGGSGIVLIQTNVAPLNSGTTAVVQVGNPRRRSPFYTNAMGSEVNRFSIIDSASMPTYKLPTHWYADPISSNSDRKNDDSSSKGQYTIQTRADGGTSNVWYATASDPIYLHCNMMQTLDAVFMPVEKDVRYDMLLKGGGNDANDIQLDMGSDGTAKLYRNWNSTLIASSTEVCFTVGKWHHIALTIDSGGNAIGYVNGYPVVTGTHTSTKALGSRNVSSFFRGGDGSYGVTFRKHLTYEVSTYNFLMSPKQVLQRAAEVGLGPKLEYDGLNTIKILNTEPGSTVKLFTSNVEDTSNVFIVADPAAGEYTVPEAGKYYAEIKGTDTFTITKTLDVSGTFPLYAYPPRDGTQGSITNSTTADVWNTWTVSGASNGNGQYQARSNRTATGTRNVYKAFSNNIGTGGTGEFQVTHGGSTHYTGTLDIQLPSAKTIRKYVIWTTDSAFYKHNSTTYTDYDPTLPYNGSERNYRRIKSWTIQGSNNDSVWTTIHTVTNKPPSIYGDVHTISSPASYQYYRLNWSDNNGSTETTCIAELIYYGD